MSNGRNQRQRAEQILKNISDEAEHRDVHEEPLMLRDDVDRFLDVQAIMVEAGHATWSDA